MTTAPMVQSRSSLERWAALGGVVYVVLFVVGAIVAYDGTPDGDSAPAKVVAYYSDSGHRDKIAFGWLIVLVAVFALLWFVGALRQWLRRIDGDGLLSTVATIGGTIYATGTLVGFSLDVAVRTMSDDTYRDRVYPGIIHAAGDAAYVIHSAGGVGAAAMIIAASVGAMGAGAIPRWAGWTGVVFGIAAVFSVFFFPQALIAIWLLVAGTLLFRSRA